MRQVQRYLMEITEIRMFLVNDGKLKATLSTTFDDEFVVKGIKVIEEHPDLGYFHQIPLYLTHGRPRPLRAAG